MSEAVLNQAPAAEKDSFSQFFAGRNITIISAATDMRRGYSGLLTVCRAFNIDPEEGKDAVLFVSRTRRVAKIIWSDRNNGYCMCCYPHGHALKQLLTMSNDPFGIIRLTPRQLDSYISGAALFRPVRPLAG